MSLPTVEKIWMDGQLVDWDKAQVHVLTHALHYGTGVFEGIRCYEQADGGSAVFRLTEHMERFERSAKMLFMDLGYSVDELVEAVKETIRVNGLKSCYIRPIAFRGYGVMGLDPLPAPVNVVIACWSWGAYMGEEALRDGVDAGISSWRQRGINACPPAIKATANYLNSSLARIEANQHGYVEAIMLNEQGLVAEGTGENIFIVRDGIISTPPVSDGILQGITRDSIIVLADELDIPVVEESIVRTDLYTCDEMFMTGSAAEVTPVRSVDHRAIGPAGPITLELQRKFFRVVRGEEPDYAEWLERL
ncbi:MAG TPA: branched-chain amino acid transaminase [Coriobacteriia bacterium]|nr:branched-chain amino acid transaminase [Coriobacteriia bacterium]